MTDVKELIEKIKENPLAITDELDWVEETNNFDADRLYGIIMKIPHEFYEILKDVVIARYHINKVYSEGCSYIETNRDNYIDHEYISVRNIWEDTPTIENFFRYSYKERQYSDDVVYFRNKDINEVRKKLCEIGYVREPSPINAESEIADSDDCVQIQDAFYNSLPPQLKNNDEFNSILHRAIDNDIIKVDNGKLVKNTTKQLLAYFATKINEKFNLSYNLDQNGNPTTPWKIFENLFNEKGLKNAKNNWMKNNTRFTPTGFETIDSLFN